MHLLIQRNCQNHGGRAKEQGNDITAQLIRLEFDSTQQQHCDDHYDCGKQRIEENQLRLLL